MLLILGTLVLGLDVRAETSTCLDTYRAAYMEASTSPDPAAQNTDAVRIYEIYFDFVNDLPIAFEEARPILQRLDGIDPKTTLNELKTQMEDGRICRFFGYSTMSLKSATNSLRKSLISK